MCYSITKDKYIFFLTNINMQNEGQTNLKEYIIC